ncbi:MAG: DUF1294 domain-containing protein [Chloroflexi bacterium]|jgi:uncharacterized membrane protein YsdA (DUF1294 family)|nr:DUF1294 domain-containing protein [Chloroflexota bacterium]
MARRRYKKPLSPVKFYTTAAVFLAATGTFLLHEKYTFSYLETWLIMVNSIAFFFFVFDKLLAIYKWRRIPEDVLCGIALAGGSVGGLVGMLLAWHKIKKPVFMRVYLMIIVVQAIGGCIWYFAIR